MTQLSFLDLLRGWAAVTGLLLVAAYFAVLYVGTAPAPLLPMLVAAIGGFELFLCTHGLWQKRRRTRG